MTLDSLVIRAEEYLKELEIELKEKRSYLVRGDYEEGTYHITVCEVERLEGGIDTIKYLFKGVL